MSASPASHPQSQLVWQLRSRQLTLGPMPALMGIVNVTPDSFSDGGKYFTPSQAVEQALRLEDEGADIIDLGGESTRPYSDSVTDEEELRRVVPVLNSLAERVQIPISIDTTKSTVARAAIDLGAEILNDVSGLEADPEMLPLAAGSQVGVCAMHMRGTPQTMQDDPQYQDVVSEIHDYLRARDEALQIGGVATSRICLDPGIGFGKTHAHNLELLRACPSFHSLGRPLLVGHSRKGFLGKVIGDPSADRQPASVGVSLALARAGVHVLRIHDVRATREALLAFAAAGGLDEF